MNYNDYDLSLIHILFADPNAIWLPSSELNKYENIYHITAGELEGNNVTDEQSE